MIQPFPAYEASDEDLLIHKYALDFMNAVSKKVIQVLSKSRESEHCCCLNAETQEKVTFTCKTIDLVSTKLVKCVLIQIEQQGSEEINEIYFMKPPQYMHQSA